MADRDERGRFLKGNQIAKGTHVYAPRSNSGYFKNTVTDILNQIPVQDVIDRMYQLENDKFVYIYSEFMKIKQNGDNAELKAQIEKIKLDREKDGGYDDTKTINISFEDIAEDSDEEND